MTTGPPLMSMVESYLKLTATRERAIASNMANIDTPGYRTRDIAFESELKRVMSEGLRQSEGGGETMQLSPVVRQVQGLIERPDGNNVSLDHEGLLLAKSQLQYQLAIQLIQSDFHETLSAINGGN